MTTPFLESPIFPDDLGVWAMGGVGYNTTVTTSTSGYESRNSIWMYGRGQWDLQNAFRTTAGVADPYSIQTLRNFFRVCKGQAYGFRFRDWTDYKDEGQGLLGQSIANYGIQVIPTGAGLGGPTYQMYKAYISTPLSDYRLIAKPRSTDPANPLVILRNNVPVTVGTSPGNCAVDTTSGLVTFVPDSTENVSSWTPGSSTSFGVPSVPSGWAVGVALYFSGITGDTNDVLNGQTGVITGIAGTTVTVGVNSTGLTLSGGSAAKYPQPSELMTWTGCFDTPCRFATDQFAPQLDSSTGALYGFQTLTIIEIRPGN